MPAEVSTAVLRVACVATVACIAPLAGCAPVQGFGHDPACTTEATDALAQRIATNVQSYQAPGTSADLRRSYRNDIVYGRMALSECSYNEFHARLWGDTNILGLSADLSVLTLAGIGATTGNAATASALAAASAGIVGAHAAISKDLYYQRTLPALLAQMTANRETVKAAIIDRLAQNDDSAYPLSRAEIDLAFLARASGLPAAIQNVTEAATQAKTAAEEKTLTVSGPAPAGGPDVVHARNLNARIFMLLRSAAPADLQEATAISGVLNVTPKPDDKEAWRKTMQDAIRAKVEKDGWNSLATALQAAGIKVDSL